MLGGRDVIGQEVELKAGTPPVRIVYKANAGAVRGTVENGEGATVILWPQASLSADWVRALRCGAAGAFEIGGITPGEYYAVAVDRVDPQTILQQLARNALKPVSVRVEEGSTSPVELKVTHWPE
jgi:hypothetical protein